MADYASNIYLDLNGITLDCSDFENTSEDNTERQKTMNRQNRAKGFVHGVPEYSYTCTVPVPKGGVGVDLFKMKKDKVEFGSHVELEGGGSIIFKGCKLNSVALKGATDEAIEYSIEVFALDQITDLG